MFWSTHLKDRGIQVTGQSSAGSIENIYLMQQNEAQLSILQKSISCGKLYEGVRNF